MTHGTSTSLFGDLDVEVVPDAPIGSRTWFGIGGRADLLLRPRTVEALATLVRRCHRAGVPLRVLGGGANLLVGDEGVGGIVVVLDQPVFREVRYNAEGEVSRVKVMAGADLPRTLMETVRRGLGGLVPLAGIPASIGGALHMNAGGAFGAIGDVVERVTCITRGGELVTYPRDQLQFDYRSTNIPDPLIVSAVLEVEPDDPIALRERVKEIFAFKKSTQPLAESSAGCAFRNPWDPVLEERVSAGRLIDEAGCKGERVGGASVSRQHANFIVVEPGAVAGDVIELLERVKRRVFQEAGLELEPEVVIWRRGEDDDR